MPDLTPSAREERERCVRVLSKMAVDLNARALASPSAMSAVRLTAQSVALSDAIAAIQGDDRHG